jgi:diaminopimelate epimerase
MRFAKAHGTGNDFVVLPDPDGELDLAPATVIALCDRRRGIGADGVLRVVRSAKDAESAGLAGAAEWFMDYRNSDGSIAEMCGNGVRAFARYLVESDLVAGATSFPVATRAGIVQVAVGPATITADMPLPMVSGRGETVINSITYKGTTVTVGNPNLIITLPDTAALEAIDLSRQPELSATAFPKSANVEFIVYGTPIDGADARVTMRVHERGAGETMSCGSGACAVAAAVLDAAGKPAGTVIVDVPGGRLSIKVDGATCRLTGPAVIVATGETTLI